MNRAFQAVLATLFLAALPACSGSTEPFDPFLGDVTVNATWTIDGAAPTAEICADANIANVELRFIEVGTGRVGTDSSLRASCNTPGGFSTGARVTSGTYDVQFVGLASNGALVVSTTPDRVSFAAGTSYDVVGAFEPPRDEPETLQVRVLFEEVEGGVLDVVNCDTAKVTFFDFTLRDGANRVVDSATNLTCADLPLDFDDSLIDAGTYSVQIAGRDNGVGEWNTTCTGLAVIDGEDASYTCDVSQGTVAAQATLQVDIGFADGFVAVSFLDCDTAKVTDFSYSLRDGTGAVVAQEMNLTCNDVPLFFDAGIIADTYSIQIQAIDDADASWDTTCTGLVVNEGQDAEWTCDLDRFDDTETLRVNVTFEETFGGQLDVVDCDTAKVSVFSYSLQRWTGGDTFQTVSDDFNFTCADLPLDFGEDLIDAGTYRIQIQANDNGDGLWDTTCTGLDVNEGEDATWTCDVEQI